MIDWAYYLNEIDNMAPSTLMAAEQELSKRPLISLSSIEIEEDNLTFEKIMED